MTAIKAIDSSEFQRRVERALDEGCASILDDLHLSGTGLYIANKLQRYVRDLTSYTKAKAATKRSETRSRAWSSGQDLIYAVHEMKRLAEEQQKETELVRINDAIPAPYRFSNRIEICVRYQWRRTIENPWTIGTITFVHNVNMRPDYTFPQPRRKLSTAKQEEQRQDILLQHWDGLRTLALHAVRDFLTAGGDGSKIPETFEAKPAGYDRYLNNFSCRFWRVSTSELMERAES